MSGAEEFEQAMAEVLAGAPGDAYARLLYRLAASIVRRTNFPPPAGYQRWEQDAVHEIVSEFASDERTRRRLNTIVVSATDSGSFAAMLEQAVRNFIRDKLRDTDVAHAMRRLRDVLESDGSFEQVGDQRPRQWRVSGVREQPTTLSSRELAVAAFSAGNVTIVRWSGRRGPIASRDDLSRLLVAVLTAADGSVDERTLAEVIVERRLGLALNVTVEELDQHISAEGAAGLQADGPAHSTAAEIWAQLTDAERLQLALAHLDVRSLGAALGEGKSTAATGRARLKDLLRDALRGLDDGQQVYDAVSEIAQAWHQLRTDKRSSAFDERTGEN